MPFQVVNASPTVPSFHPPSLSPPSPSRTRSSSSHDSAPMQTDRASLLSSASSDDATLLTTFSDHKLSSSPYIYLTDEPYFVQRKTLPNLPSNEKHGQWDPYDSYTFENAATSNQQYFQPKLTIGVDRSASSSPPGIQHFTTTTQLAAALGPDNAPHSTEIDTIPCAGVRIPFGPLSGLMAWRLVVRRQPVTKGKHAWWSENTVSARRRRRNSSAFSLEESSPSYPYSQEMSQKPLATASAVTLPLAYSQLFSSIPDNPSTRERHPNTAMMPMHQPNPHPHTLPRNAHSSPLHASPLNKPPTAVAANFILDTSLPHSIISRDTLLSLGYLPSQLTALDSHAPLSSSQSNEKDEEHPTITLSVQGIPTQLRIARPGEANRLGVQFLHDAGVSVFFPKNGDGVGPVLYFESARMFKDVPKTIKSVPCVDNGRMSLAQRVRALFGLS